MIHNDHLGTPQKLTDSTGTVVWAADYKPFGEATITVNTITNNLKFPGQYSDQETGLYYNFFRDYNPNIGRYPEADPIGIRRGKNHLFAYVGNNPINKKDTFGLEAELCSRNFWPMFMMPGRHCFIRFDGSNSNTLSFDPKGVHPDPAPKWFPRSCEPMKGDPNDDCLKKEMAKCTAGEYDFTGFNCCHCAEEAMNACGLSIPETHWPNYPINPGPQPGNH